MSKVIYSVPVFGWMLREAVRGPAATKVLFLINCVLMWLLAVAFFGYPAIIIPALCLVPMMFTILILITNG